MAPRRRLTVEHSSEAVVVDTCVVSFLFKGDTRRDLYRPYLEGKILVLSPMTVAELERWALVRNWGTARKYDMEQQLRQYVIQPFTRDLCVRWAEVTHSAQLQGFTILCADAWVAAVAVLNQIPLVTNNGKDFRGIAGLDVITAASSQFCRVLPRFSRQTFRTAVPGLEKVDLIDCVTFSAGSKHASGKLLVGQAGGATAVINSSLAAVIDEARRHGLEVWGMRRGAEGALREEFVPLSGLTPRDLAALSATPGAALGSSRHKLTDQDVETLLDSFARHDIRTLLYIGGNDSADSVHRLALQATARRQDLRAIAVPKTIDNDLPATDHCPGYGSIARYVAIATMDSAKDTESMPTMYPIKIIEVMGRDAGWVAAAAALGKREPQDAPHLIYLPERPVSRDRVLADVQRVYDQFGRVVAVVTETLRDESGNPFADPRLSTERDAFGHPLLRGTADTLCRLIQSELGLRSRFDKPGSLQRMSMLCVSPVDLDEAAAVGRAAVQLALQDITDRMVTLVRDSDQPYSWHTASAPLDAVANHQRLLPDEFIAANGTGVTEAFHRYAMPLLGPNPLPEYLRLA